jgi:septal ring factor EnvC (AmiA/AmiB activator)
MAATNSENDEGSDIFWPGYVDAVTNLVLNLLFVLTIMIVAVLMFAMALSRKQEEKVSEAVQQERKTVEHNIQQKDQQLIELQQQIEQLKATAEVKNSLTTPQKTAQAKTPVAIPDKSIEKLLENGGGVVVNFSSDAVTINDSELAAVEKLLAPLVSSGSVTLVVNTPKGFSEAKRLAFYRAMSVRSLLINMGLAQNKIETSIRESNAAADNSKVMVLKGGGTP